MGGEELGRSRDFFHFPAPAAVFGPFDADGIEPFEFTLVVEDKVFGRDAVFSWVWTRKG